MVIETTTWVLLLSHEPSLTRSRLCLLHVYLREFLWPQGSWNSYNIKCLIKEHSKYLSDKHPALVFFLTGSDVCTWYKYHRCSLNRGTKSRAQGQRRGRVSFLIQVEGAAQECSSGSESRHPDGRQMLENISEQHVHFSWRDFPNIHKHSQVHSCIHRTFYLHTTIKTCPSDTTWHSGAAFPHSCLE